MSVISVNIGGAGVNIGKACLEVSAEEHGLGTDGFFIDEDVARSSDINHHVVFREDSIGRWTPRSLFIDVENDAIDQLLSSNIGELVAPSQFRQANQSGVYYFRANYTIGRDFFDEDLFRREAE